MNKEEFISKLRENKQQFKDIEELVNYQLPVLQYYLEHYQGNYILDNRQLGGDLQEVDFSKITLTSSYTPSSLQLMKMAFSGLVKRIKEFEHD